MDLLALFHSLMRHKVIAAVVLAFVAAGNAYVLFGVAPVYECKTQFVLVNPPPPPTDDEIRQNPALAKLNADNPYLRMPNPSVVVDVLAQRVSGENVRRELMAAGADGDYQIAPTNAIGSGLVIEITGTGSTAGQSRRTLDLVSDRMKADLRAMQKVNGADDRFLIQALLISPPTDPQRRVTSTARSLIALTAAGVVALFAFISVAEAVGPRRARRRTGQPEFPPGSAGPELTIVLPRLEPPVDPEATRKLKVHEKRKPDEPVVTE